MTIPKHISKHIIRFSVYILIFILLKTAWWLKVKFGSPTIDQIIFHLQNGSDGLADTNPKIIKSFIKHVLIAPLLYASLLFGLQQFILSERIAQFIKTASTKNVLHGTSSLFAHMLSILRFLFNRYIPVIILLCSGIYLSWQVSLFSHIRNLESSGFIDQNYVTPNQIISPKKKLNLVLIYVESLENGYGDPSLMGKNLLASLDMVTTNAYRFDQYKQTYGTGWTMGGIVGTQCGIPLKSHTIFDKNRQGEHLTSFLPGAVCLGDILGQHGYKNLFMGGASLFFAGKEKFLSQHGYSEMYGKEEWSQAGEKNFNDWGLYDDQLFLKAKARIDQLEKTNHPYNLTLLTLDTHPPYGHISPTCQKKGVKDYKGIVTCTSDLVADFVTYIRQRGYLENTVVVILGDHLSMQAPLEETLDKSRQRTIYNRFITPQKLHQNRQEIYHFGVLPSILYAMNFRFNNNRLALGTSGFGKIVPNIMLTHLDSDDAKDLLAKKSALYSTFRENSVQKNTVRQQK